MRTGQLDSLKLCISHALVGVVNEEDWALLAVDTSSATGVLSLGLISSSKVERPVYAGAVARSVGAPHRWGIETLLKPFALTHRRADSS